MYILDKFNTFSRSWKSISQINTVWEQCWCNNLQSKCWTWSK